MRNPAETPLMAHVRRPGPLQVTRASVAVAWCLSLGFAALLLSDPLALGALCAGVVTAGVLAGIGPQLRRLARFVVPLALSIAVVNALVTRDGLTVIARLGNLPVLGSTDVTMEAAVYGAILGLRAATLVLIGALYTLAVDPDAVLALMRRLSFRSALTVSIANRMVPVLMRDSSRLADAQRCRPGPSPGRIALMRATTAGVLDRALDVAAALEVRGYGESWAGNRRRRRAPWSRHDIAFAVSAALVTLIAAALHSLSFARFSAYPTLVSPSGPQLIGASVLLVLCVIAPFADRRGVW
jgi:energy-coupling factor transport system permease protein